MTTKNILIIISLILLLGFGVYFFMDHLPKNNKNLSSEVIPTSTTNVQKKTARESFIAQASGHHHEAKIMVTIGNGHVVAGRDIDPNTPYEWFTVKEHGEIYTAAIITGYLYTYIYNDLGIKITTPPLYDPYFFKKTDDRIIKRINNVIYPASLESSDGTILQYLAVFTKDKIVPLEQEIIANHLPAGATIRTGTVPKDEITPPFASMRGRETIYIASQDGNLAPNGEVFDKQFPENQSSIVFVMDPKRPDRYYKLSYTDCAPGPCSIFGTIEFF